MRSGTAYQLSPIARKQRALAGLGLLGVSAPSIPIGQGSGKGAESGAVSGASLGTTIMPGIGTAIGAVVGAVAGAIAGAIGKQDPEIQNFNQGIAIWQQNPDAVYQLANKYLVLAGFYDLNQNQAGKIRIYRKYGRMGEERFTRDMVAQVYQAAQSGQITPQDSAVSVYQKVILPWEDSWGFGPEPSNPHSDFMDRLLTGLIFDYVTGYGPAHWYSRSGPLPASFSSIPPFAFPTVAAVPTSPTTAAAPATTSAVPAFPGWSSATLPSDPRLTVPWTETENGYTTTLTPVAGGNNLYSTTYPDGAAQFQWALSGSQLIGLRKSPNGWGKYTGTLAADGVTVSGSVTMWTTDHPTGWTYPFNAVISGTPVQTSSTATVSTVSTGPLQTIGQSTVLTSEGSTITAGLDSPYIALQDGAGNTFQLGQPTAGVGLLYLNGKLIGPSASASTLRLYNGQVYLKPAAGNQWGTNTTTYVYANGSWNTATDPWLPATSTVAPATSTTSSVTPATAVSVPAGFTLVGSANNLQAYLGPDGLYYTWSGTTMTPLTGTLTGLNGTSANVISGQIQTTPTVSNIQSSYSAPVPDYSAYSPPAQTATAPVSTPMQPVAQPASGIPTWAWLGLGAGAVYLLMGRSGHRSRA